MIFSTYHHFAACSGDIFDSILQRRVKTPPRQTPRFSSKIRSHEKDSFMCAGTAECVLEMQRASKKQAQGYA
jgi:hypothetical protein